MSYTVTICYVSYTCMCVNRLSGIATVRTAHGIAIMRLEIGTFIANILFVLAVIFVLISVTVK